MQRELLKQKLELSNQSKIRFFSLPETMQLNQIPKPNFIIIVLLNLESRFHLLKKVGLWELISPLGLESMLNYNAESTDNDPKYKKSFFRNLPYKKVGVSDISTVEGVQIPPPAP